MPTIKNEAVLKLIREAKNILVFTHKQPDGDAIGSALALKLMFEQMGKNADVCCEDYAPHKFLILKGASAIKKPSEISFPPPYDLAVSVDASDELRLGTAYALFEKFEKTIQMDHHATNTYFAKENEVDDTTPASGVLVMRLAHALDISIDKDIAMCIYTATSMDTGNFCFSGVNAEVFAQMAELMKTEFPFADCARQIHLNKSMPHLKLKGKALSAMKEYEDGQVHSLQLSKQDFLDAQANADDGDGIVNSGLYIEGTKLCFMGTETDEGVKFSLRCLEGFDVARVAKGFGGGGHRLAAGCLIKDSLENAMEKMLAAVREELFR